MRHRTERPRRITFRRPSYAALFAMVRGLAFTLGAAVASVVGWWLGVVKIVASTVGEGTMAVQMMCRYLARTG